MVKFRTSTIKTAAGAAGIAAAGVLAAATASAAPPNIQGFGTSEHIRVSYATSKTELDRGLERMRKFFAAL